MHGLTWHPAPVRLEETGGLAGYLLLRNELDAGGVHLIVPGGSFGGDSTEPVQGVLVHSLHLKASIWRRDDEPATLALLATVKEARLLVGAGMLHHPDELRPAGESSH